MFVLPGAGTKSTVFVGPSCNIILSTALVLYVKVKSEPIVAVVLVTVIPLVALIRACAVTAPSILRVPSTSALPSKYKSLYLLPLIYPLEKVFGMVSKRMTLFIQEKLDLSEKEAKEYIDWHNETDKAYTKKSKLNIEIRSGEYTRCKGNYCSVAEFCNQ